MVRPLTNDRSSPCKYGVRRWGRGSGADECLLLLASPSAKSQTMLTPSATQLLFPTTPPIISYSSPWQFSIETRLTLYNVPPEMKTHIPKMLPFVCLDLPPWTFASMPLSLSLYFSPTKSHGSHISSPVCSDLLYHHPLILISGLNFVASISLSQYFSGSTGPSCILPACSRLARDIIPLYSISICSPLVMHVILAWPLHSS